MPSVQEALGALEGASASDVNTDAGFDAALASQASAEPTPREASSESSTTRDPSQDTAADIVSQVADREHSTRIEDGLSIKEPSTDQDRELQHYARQDVQEALRRRTDELLGTTAEDREAAHVQAASDAAELAVRRFEALNTDDPNEILSGLTELRAQITPDQFDGVVLALATQMTGLDPQDLDGYEWDDADAEEFEYVLDTIHAEVDRHAADSEIYRMRVALEQTRQEAARQWEPAQKAALSAYFKSQGVTSEEVAQQRVREAATVALADGVNLDAFDPTTREFLQEFARYDLHAHEAKKAIATNALHNQMLNGDSRDVASGIEYLSGGRYINPNRVEVEVDPVKIAERAALGARRRVKSGDDLKAAMLRPDRNSVEHGFTSNGKPVDFAEVNGSRKAAKEEAERRRAADRLAF